MTHKDLIEDKEYFIKCDYEFKENGKEKEAIDNYYYCLECFPQRYSDCDCDPVIKNLIWIKDGLKVFTEIYKQAILVGNKEVIDISKLEINKYRKLLEQSYPPKVS